MRRNDFSVWFFATAFLFPPLFSSVGRADILFLNLNLAYSEMQAAESAAAKRGEKVIFIPSYDPSDPSSVAYVQRLVGEKNAADDAYDKWSDSWRTHGGKCSPGSECNALFTRQQDLQKKLFDDMASKNYFFTQDKIEKAIAREEARHRTITSVVISGHSDGQSMWGLLVKNERQGVGAINAMTNALQEHPMTRGSIEAIYPWGCYSTTKENYSDWASKFPNTKFVMGFAGIGPADGTEADSAILEDALLKEGHILTAKNLRDAVHLISGIRDFSDAYTAGGIGRCWVPAPVTQAKPSLLTFDTANEISRSCLTQFGVLQTEYKNAFAKYLEAREKGFEDPPFSLDASPLRDFYNHLQLASNCNSNGYEEITPNPLQVLALIHWQIVEQNFIRRYRDRLEAVNAYLRSIHAPADSFLPTSFQSPLSRQAFLHRWRGAADVVGKRLNEDSPTSPYYILHAMYQLDSLNGCIPEGWITNPPNADPRIVPEPLKCGDN